MTPATRGKNRLMPASFNNPTPSCKLWVAGTTGTVFCSRRMSPRSTLLALAFLCASPRLPAADSADAAYFGTTDRKSGGLLGILYDLKQSQDRKALDMNPAIYDRVIAKFVNEGWDESELDPYYRATRAIYATRIFIPDMQAEAAPAAFGEEKNIRPMQWLAHYKGQVQAPRAGTYRFVGAGDDWIGVAVNGRNVLVSHWPGANFPGVEWKSSEPPQKDAVKGNLLYGDWFEVKQGETIDIDIAIGEIPGALFSAWLFFQEKGVAYEAGPNGAPVLPIFQIGNAPMPNLEGKRYPPFAPNSAPWQPAP